ncbi:hypothetical protein QJS04_geneDACA021396 [Acorus gramineus]|uniref:MI domain-containing protein n=1 Tax=Acorus gramineus TaxID=55184 RepID=A0AAV9A5N3_ACOGR|nr:hypothetical protein QJS04_geneDACA021396 [Acorus gramineus]
MEFHKGNSSQEHKEIPNLSHLEITRSPRSPRASPRSPRMQHSSGSPLKGGSGRGSPVKHDRVSHSRRDGRPKKCGSGGKGTWGGLLDTGDSFHLDPNDPNYDSSDDSNQMNTSNASQPSEEFKKKVTVIIEEYFATDDVVSTTGELRDLGHPAYLYYFVKKLVSMSMDRNDKEKEMAAVLLSSLYADVLDPPQVRKGFSKLVESSDDLAVDVPDMVDTLALFIARAVVDDMLPPSFLTKQMAKLPNGSKGIDVLRTAEKGYLSAPLHAENIERKWGGSKNKTVEDMKAKIRDLLIEYGVCGDKREALRCIKDLNVPHFHHEIVKRAILIAMEKRSMEVRILDLLKGAAEDGFINSSQMSKGFARLIEVIDDLSLDIPNARQILQSLISKAASEGWLSASSLKSLNTQQANALEDDEVMKLFKAKATSMIHEYFLTGDLFEVMSGLAPENHLSSPALNAIFVKKLILLAMDRKNREKEMASVLLTTLSFATEDIVNGFVMLLESVEDTALDNPVVVEDLAKFIARAVVDEVLAPLNLSDIERNSDGEEVLRMARSLLGARFAGERMSRCWGGGGSGRAVGWAIEDVKERIEKALEEYETGGDAREACRCIKELGMPFFHHEVVKKALVNVMEKKNERLWGLLEMCFDMGLVTENQMKKGFERVREGIDDLKLDVPDVEREYKRYVERAKENGWLDSDFSIKKSVEGEIC